MPFWEKDIPFPKFLRNEVSSWKTLWKSTDRELPNNLLLALGACDEDAFPNIHRLLVIACTLLIKSTEAEWSFALMKWIKTCSQQCLKSSFRLHWSVSTEFWTRTSCWYCQPLLNWKEFKIATVINLVRRGVHCYWGDVMIPEKKTALFWLSKANDGLTLSLKDINSLREALRSVFITKNTKGLVISENHRQRPRWYKFEFSFLGNDRQPSQKSGMRREKDLFPTIPDDRGYLRFPVFVSGQNLGRSGNSKIHERLEFSRHINTRFKQAKKS